MSDKVSKANTQEVPRRLSRLAKWVQKKDADPSDESGSESDQSTGEEIKIADVKLARGLTYKPDVIDEELEAKLLEFINKQTWNTALLRRTQHYGHVYNYTTKAVSDEKAPPIPEIFQDLIEKLKLDGPDQIIVNEYVPGQGIAPHVDNVRQFGPQVATLSLGAGIQMDFKKGSDEYAIYLARRSLVVLEDDARYLYTHGIVGRKSDLVNGRKVPRTTRVSITFRKKL